MISSVDPTNGGPIEGIVRSAAALGDLGVSVEIVSLDSSDLPAAEACPVRVHALGSSSGSYRFSKALVPWLRQNAANYDAVVVSGLWQYASFGTWRALQGRKPYYVFPHGMLDPWFKTTYPLKHAKKCLYWPWAEYRVLRDAEAVLFTSEEERLNAQGSFRPYGARERVVSYGTAAPTGDADAQVRAFQTICPESVGKRVLLFLGRIHPKKGVDMLLKAFAAQGPRHPESHLVVAGPDPIGWKQELQELAAGLGIGNRVSWPGMLAGDEKWGAFRSADAFVLPSHQENFGIAVAEALACGTPTLISDRVNIYREIAEDRAGIVAPDTEEGTRELLDNWFALPQRDRESMATNAQSTFSRRFEIRAAALSLLDALAC